MHYFKGLWTFAFCCLFASFSLPVLADPTENNFSEDQQAPATRGVRPSFQQFAPRVTDSSSPLVQSASTKLRILKIGGQFGNVTLNGKNLNEVKKAVVVNSQGKYEAGFHVSIISRARTNTKLLLSIAAGQPVNPGKYFLRLNYFGNPLQQGKPRPLRHVLVSNGIITVLAKKMNPRITKFNPPEPVSGEKMIFRVTLSDVPGETVTKITRWREGTNNIDSCQFKPWSSRRPPEPKETYTHKWVGPNKLQITFSTGSLSYYGTERCSIRMVIRTTNRWQDEFYSTPPRKRINLKKPKPRQEFVVKNTWALKKYLKIVPWGIPRGACKGKSIGPRGSFPIGVTKSGRDLSFKARSGPIGTRCGWKVSTNKLRNRWSVKLHYNKYTLGKKCIAGKGSGYLREYRRTEGLYVRGKSRRTLKRNEVANRNQFHLIDLSCGVTLSNDNEVSLKVDSATVYGPPVDVPAKNCTWKCGFQ